MNLTINNVKIDEYFTIIDYIDSIIFFFHTLISNDHIRCQLFLHEAIDACKNEMEQKSFSKLTFNSNTQPKNQTHTIRLILILTITKCHLQRFIRCRFYYYFFFFICLTNLLAFILCSMD